MYKNVCPLLVRSSMCLYASEGLEPSDAYSDHKRRMTFKFRFVQSQTEETVPYLLFWSVRYKLGIRVVRDNDTAKIRRLVVY